MLLLLLIYNSGVIAKLFLYLLLPPLSTTCLCVYSMNVRAISKKKSALVNDDLLIYTICMIFIAFNMLKLNLGRPQYKSVSYF